MSRYPDEDERIMIGGSYPILVSSVRIIDSGKNYKQTFAILSLLDRIISAGTIGHDEVNEDILKSVNKLFLDEESAFDPYVRSMIQSYIRNKQTITFRMQGLSRVSETLLGFIFIGNVLKIPTAYWNPRDDTDDIKSSSNRYQHAYHEAMDMNNDQSINVEELQRSLIPQSNHTGAKRFQLPSWYRVDCAAKGYLFCKSGTYQSARYIGRIEHGTIVRVAKIQGRFCKIDVPKKGWIEWLSNDDHVWLQLVNIDNDPINLISGELFNLFYKTSNLVIKTDAGGPSDGHYSYPINMFQFLPIIKGIPTLKCIRVEQLIRQWKDKPLTESWITRHWSASSEMLIGKYRQQGIKTEYKETVVHRGAQAYNINYSFDICKI